MDSNIEYNRRAQKERLRKREENIKGKFYLGENVFECSFNNFFFSEIKTPVERTNNILFKDLGRESPSKKARINGDKVFPKDDFCNGKRNSLDSLEDAKVHYLVV